MTTWKQDLQYGLRGFARTPGFTAAAVLVLGVGIGANAAMFTLVDAMVLKPLSGRAGELTGVYCGSRTRPDSFHAFSYANYTDIRDRSGLFDGLLAHTFSRTGEPSGDGVRRVLAEFVSSNYFDTLGTRLAAGRGFTSAEERPGAGAPVAIASHARWKAAGFSPSFVGSTIRLNGHDLTVIGVTPEGFTGTMAMLAAEVYLPLGLFDAMVRDPRKTSGQGLADRGNRALVLAGIPKAGLSASLVTERLDALARELETAYPSENEDLALVASPLPRVGMSTSPGTDAGLGVFSGFLLLLSGTVLVIACLNIANMLVARGVARRKEIALRLALGAGRGRVVRQLLTESLALSAAGTLVGVLAGAAVMKALATSLAGVFPVPVRLDAWPDAAVLAASAAAAVLSALVFGFGPALTLSRGDLVADLKHQGATGGSGAHFAGGRALVVGQIALALVLLTAGGIFARTALAASLGTPGHRYERILLASLDTTLGAYDAARGRQVIGRVLDRARALPGVESASLTSSLAFGDSHENRRVEAVGRTGQPDGALAKAFRVVGADYFATLGLRVVRGREFSSAEEMGGSGPRSAIIDETLARRLFGDEDPIGQPIRIRAEPGQPAGQPEPPLQVVGIAPPMRDELLDRGPVSHLYVPFGLGAQPRMHVQVRLKPGVDETAAVAALRRAIRAEDARLPVVTVTTMKAFHETGVELWALRAGGQLFTGIGLLAMLLASVGIFGLMSYVVSRRRPEFGVRMALGATPGDVLRLVARDGARITGLALAIGLPLAALVSIAFTKVFVEIGGFDPVTIAGAAAVLAAAAMAASLLPGRRASRVAPMSALRSE
jgi:predicted permease